MTETKGHRFIWLDAMRVLAGLSMVGLHATADATGQPFPGFAEEDRIIPMMIRAFLYVARTELFLIISIFLLLMASAKNRRSYSETIGLQVQRLLIPFAFWTLFYTLYTLLKAGYFGYLDSYIAQISSLNFWASALLLGTSKYHMHFIPTLFGLLLLYPLFIAARRQPALGLLVLLCLMLKREADLFIYRTYWGSDLLPYAIRLIKILSYAGYGLVAASFLGLYDRYGTRLPQSMMIAFVFLGIGLIAFKLDATRMTIETGKWPYDHTAGYWADFLMPVVLFALCMGTGGRQWPPVLSRLAPYSFGIYLCHPIFLDMSEMLVATQQQTPLGQILTKIAITLPATALLVLGLSHSRLLGWTIGLGAYPFHRADRRAGPA